MIFNPDDYTTNANTEDILNEVADNYLRNNGVTNSSAITSFLGPVNLTGDTTISGNITVNSLIISPVELSQLDGINTNQTINASVYRIT